MAKTVEAIANTNSAKAKLIVYAAEKAFEPDAFQNDKDRTDALYKAIEAILGMTAPEASATLKMRENKIALL